MLSAAAAAAAAAGGALAACGGEGGWNAPPSSRRRRRTAARTPSVALLRKCRQRCISLSVVCRNAQFTRLLLARHRETHVFTALSGICQRTGVDCVCVRVFANAACSFACVRGVYGLRALVCVLCSAFAMCNAAVASGLHTLVFYRQ